MRADGGGPPGPGLSEQPPHRTMGLFPLQNYPLGPFEVESTRVFSIGMKTLAFLFLVAAGSSYAGDTISLQVDCGDGAGMISGHIHPIGGVVVADTAYAAPSAFVDKDAFLCGRARVLGNASILGRAVIRDRAVIDGWAQIGGNAIVAEDARVHGNALVMGQARIYGHAEIFGGCRSARRGESLRRRGGKEPRDRRRRSAGIGGSTRAGERLGRRAGDDNGDFANFRHGEAFRRSRRFRRFKTGGQRSSFRPSDDRKFTHLRQRPGLRRQLGLEFDRQRQRLGVW